MRDRVHWRLLFSGRMEFLKGGHVFLASLPIVAAALDKPLQVTFAGDGRMREEWQRIARRLQRRHSGIEVKFVGWVDRVQMKTLFDDSDLLVVPSLWPEPLGLVGPEAGLQGVPVAAFSVGGIPDWLVNGVNGHLAPGDPPTSSGLASAIVQCLSDARTHENLRRGAVNVARRFSIENHVAGLMKIFEQVICRASRAEAEKIVTEFARALG